MNQGEWCVFRVQAALKYKDDKEFKKNKLRTLSLKKWEQRNNYPFNSILEAMLEKGKSGIDPSYFYYGCSKPTRYEQNIMTNGKLSVGNLLAKVICSG